MGLLYGSCILLSLEVVSHGWGVEVVVVGAAVGKGSGCEFLFFFVDEHVVVSLVSHSLQHLNDEFVGSELGVLGPSAK